jgi:hypothetical protein
VRSEGPSASLAREVPTPFPRAEAEHSSHLPRSAFDARKTSPPGQARAISRIRASRDVRPRRGKDRSIRCVNSPLRSRRGAGGEVFWPCGMASQGDVTSGQGERPRPPRCKACKPWVRAARLGGLRGERLSIRHISVGTLSTKPFARGKPHPGALYARDRACPCASGAPLASPLEESRAALGGAASSFGARSANSPAAPGCTESAGSGARLHQLTLSCTQRSRRCP